MGRRRGHCPTRGKSSWRTQPQAERALEKILKDPRTSESPSRAYLCVCGRWHLTKRKDGAS